eukprot:tig00001098_g7062.t1
MRRRGHAERPLAGEEAEQPEGDGGTCEAPQLLDPAAVAFSREHVEAVLEHEGSDVRLERALGDLAARVGRARRWALGILPRWGAAADEHGRRELHAIAGALGIITVAPVDVQGEEGARIAYVSLDNRRLWLFRRLREALPAPLAAEVRVAARVVPLEALAEAERRAGRAREAGRVFSEARVLTSKGEATAAFNYVAVQRARGRYGESLGRDAALFLLALALALFLYTRGGLRS